MKIKVSEATGPVLDWMVGVAEGNRVFRLRVGRPDNWVVADYDLGKDDRWVVRAQVPNVGRFADYTYTPSTNWAQGGPIVEENSVSVFRLEDTERTDAEGFWKPGRDPLYGAVAAAYFAEDTRRNSYGENCGDIFYINTERVITGPTPLIAAMRCFCLLKLGPEVDVPEELLS